MHIRVMNEDYLQYIWRFQYLPHSTLACTSGRELTVLHAGHWNRHGGPDFLEAKLRIGRETWVGSVEVHIRSSDWHRHQHSDDPAYRNVILHVVYEDDKPLINHAGQEVPTLVLKPLLDKQHLERYHAFMSAPDRMPCARHLHQVTGMARDAWLHRMAVERLEERTRKVGSLLNQYQNDWNAVWWHMLCRAFGFGLNRNAYEMLATSLPWKIVAKLADKPASLEALLMVQSGWYYVDKKLICHARFGEEYQHYKRLWKLRSLHPSAWYRSRMMPANHPRVRLGQLAALVHAGVGQWRSIVNAQSLAELRTTLKTQMPVLALNLGARVGQSAPLGARAIDLLIANAAVPMLFFLGKLQNDTDLCERALGWMEDMPPENNKTIRQWKSIGWKPHNLLETQGLIHLFGVYCCQKKCLSCSIGISLLKNHKKNDTKDLRPV